MIKGYTVGKNEYTGELNLTIFHESGDPISLREKDLIEVKDNIDTVFSFLETVKSPEEQEKDKLIGIINDLAKQIEYLSNNLDFDDIKRIASDWQSEGIYPRYAYVRYEDEYYKLIHPKRLFDKTPPNEDSVMYEKIGGVDEDTGLQELTPSATNSYKKGDIGTYNGHVFQSNYDNNITTPNINDVAPAWWTDLGLIEEYQGA